MRHCFEQIPASVNNGLGNLVYITDVGDYVKAVIQAIFIGIRLPPVVCTYDSLLPVLTSDNITNKCNCSCQTQPTNWQHICLVLQQAFIFLQPMSIYVMD